MSGEGGSQKKKTGHAPDVARCGGPLEHLHEYLHAVRVLKDAHRRGSVDENAEEGVEHDVREGDSRLAVQSGGGVRGRGEVRRYGGGDGRDTPGDVEQLDEDLWRGAQYAKCDRGQVESRLDTHIDGVPPAEVPLAAGVEEGDALYDGQRLCELCGQNGEHRIWISCVVCDVSQPVSTLVGGANVLDVCIVSAVNRVNDFDIQPRSLNGTMLRAHLIRPRNRRMKEVYDYHCTEMCPGAPRTAAARDLGRPHSRRSIFAPAAVRGSLTPCPGVPLTTLPRRAV